MAAWVTLLTFFASSPCLAQTTDPATDEPAQAVAPSQDTVSRFHAPAMPRSRRVLTTDEFAALVGQTLSLSVRTRWPRRAVEGVIVSVTADAVLVDTGNEVRSLPRTKTVVASPLPGDFFDLMGQEIQVTGTRRFPPSEITGRVIGVDPLQVTIDSDGETVRLPIASTRILSRAPGRDRRLAMIAAIAGVIGGNVWAAHKCRNGGC